MKTKTFKLEVGFTTEYFPENIEAIVLELTEEDIEKILKHKKYLEENPDLFKVVGDACATYMADDEEESNFRYDGAELFIFKRAVYVYAQSKYDSGTQIESESLSIETIVNTKFDQDENYNLLAQYGQP